MTIVNFEFNPSTRTLREDRKVYAGQVGDSLSTTIHIRYTDDGFLSTRDPYIVFEAYDDEGNPLVYARDSEHPFDGVEFTVPWDVTVRCKSARIQFQVFYIEAGVEFDIRNVAQLASEGVEITMSSKAGIAIRPSIMPKKQGAAPFTPTGASPTVLGFIDLWKKTGLVKPVSDGYDANGMPYIEFHTYSGEDDQRYMLPVGNSSGKIPLLKGPVANGETIIYSEAAGGFVSGSSLLPKGTVTSAWLDDHVFSAQPGDVYNLSDSRTYNGEVYRAGTNWILDVGPSGARRWEPLTGDVSHDAYQTKANMAESWDNLTAEQYPSALMVRQRMADIEEDIDDLDSELSGDIDRIDGTITELDGRLTSAEGNLDALAADLHANYYTTTQIDEKLAVTMQFKSVSADADGYPDVPLAERNTYTIYLVPSRTSKSKNVKDEYIWDAVEEEWELVGSTTMKLNIVQTDAGITINDTALQIATENRAGLMPADAVQFLDDVDTDLDNHDAAITDHESRIGVLETASRDHTTYEMAIGEWSSTRTYNENSTVIHNGTLYISLSDLNVDNEPSDESEHWTMVTGGGGGSITSVTTVFGNDNDTSYTLLHKFNSYDFLFTIRTNDSVRRYVSATVYASDKNHARVQLTEPPGVNGLVINMVKCTGRAPEEETVKTVGFDEESMGWEVENEWEYPAFVQTYTWDDEEEYYDEMRADVFQPPSGNFTPIEIEFMIPRSGFAVLARSEIQMPFEDTDTVVIPHGDANQLYAVQMYDTEEGMITGDVAQNGGTVTVSFDRARTGWVVLTRPAMVVHFDDRASGRVVHNLGRFVGMQVYADNMEGQAMLDCHNIDENTCEADFNGTFSGYLLII